MYVGGVQLRDFRGFQPILAGPLEEKTLQEVNICRRFARERAQVSSTPYSSASADPHRRPQACM